LTDETVVSLANAMHLLATVADATKEVGVLENDQTKIEDTANKHESVLEGRGNVVDDARIQNNDVLFGRGFALVGHPGNMYYRQLVNARKSDFNAARKKEKKNIAIQIIHDIANLEPPGRFLMEDPQGSVQRKMCILQDVQLQRHRECCGLQGTPSDQRCAEPLHTYTP
jgi:hypothetical protein